jgi:uncharacterized protein with FMN-binding domain
MSVLPIPIAIGTGQAIIPLKSNFIMMKTTLFSGLVICFLITQAFSCQSAKLEKENFSVSEYQDGVYNGYSKNIDEMSVQVTIENKKIKEVKLIKFGATPFGHKAKDSIPQRIVEKQLPYVDAVSGATEASNVIMNATADALKKAMKKIPLN